MRVKRSLEKNIPVNMIIALQGVDNTYIQAVRQKYNLKMADKRETVWRMSGRVPGKRFLSNTTKE